MLLKLARVLLLIAGTLFAVALGGFCLALVKGWESDPAYIVAYRTAMYLAGVGLCWGAAAWLGLHDRPRFAHPIDESPAP